MNRRIAVLASGGGTNLQAILDYFAQPSVAPLGAITLVASDRKSCGALDRARAHGIEAVTCAPAEIGSLLETHAIDMVALAGYLRFVPEEVTRRFEGRLVNVHPALLPAFGGAGMYGRSVHEAVLRAGVRVTGVTVHFVNDVYDSGRIIAQWPVPVLDGDTAESLSARVLAVEHLLYPRALAALASGRVPSMPGDLMAFAPASQLTSIESAMDAWLASTS